MGRKMLEAASTIGGPEGVTTSSKSKFIKFAEEPLNLYCQWSQCDAKYQSWEKFDAHLVSHVETDLGFYICRWGNCSYDAKEGLLLTQHLSYHGYISKLCNIGQNVVDRSGLPECKLEQALDLPLERIILYACLWGDCSENFNTIYNFSRHLISHVGHSDESESEHNKIECCWTGCNKYFSRPKLREHLRSHSKEKQIACPTCLTCFSNRTKFSDHRWRQSKASEKSYKCFRCQKLFHTVRLLRDHGRSHSRDHPCPECNRSFPKPSLTAKHYRFKHLQEKHYKCSTCDKAFVTKFNMEAHMRVHETERAFKCGSCDFSCCSQVGITNHLVAKHDAIGSLYGCHLCDRLYKRGGLLTRHLKRAHTIEMPDEQPKFEYEKDQEGIYRFIMPRRNVTEKVSLVPGKEVEGNVDYEMTYEFADGDVNSVPEVYEVAGGIANKVPEAYEVGGGGYANPVPDAYEVDRGIANTMPHSYEVVDGGYANPVPEAYEVDRGIANTVPDSYEVVGGGYAKPVLEAYEVGGGYANHVPEAYEVSRGIANTVPEAYEVGGGGYANPVPDAYEVGGGIANPVPEAYEVGEREYANPVPEAYKVIGGYANPVPAYEVGRRINNTALEAYEVGLGRYANPAPDAYEASEGEYANPMPEAYKVVGGYANPVPAYEVGEGRYATLSSNAYEVLRIGHSEHFSIHKSWFMAA